MKNVYKKNTFGVLFEYIKSRVIRVDSRLLFFKENEYRSFDQQIDILKNRGLIINLNTKADSTCRYFHVKKDIYTSKTKEYRSQYKIK